MHISLVRSPIAGLNPEVEELLRVLGCTISPLQASKEGWTSDHFLQEAGWTSFLGVCKTSKDWNSKQTRRGKNIVLPCSTKGPRRYAEQGMLSAANHLSFIRRRTLYFLSSTLQQTLKVFRFSLQIPTQLELRCPRCQELPFKQHRGTNWRHPYL